jgi:peptide subunit release factor 1 (eRF1)
MHDKNLKQFRNLNSNVNTSMSVKRRQYPPNVQRASRSVLNKIEVFDR